MILAIFLLSQAPAKEAVCDNAMAQQEINRCLGAESIRADDAMNVQWRATAAAMKSADKDIDREYDRQPGYFETLLAGQRAWLTYRAQQCLLESFEMRGGSGQPMLDAGCTIELTKARTRQLRDLIAHD